MTRPNILSQLEAIILVANRPLSLKELSVSLAEKPTIVEQYLAELSAEYETKDSGFRLIQAGSNYQLVSAGKHAELLKRFLKLDNSSELSPASLEALTVIAYRGPVTKLELERIRGVNCSMIIRNLLIRGLIEENFDKQKNEDFYQLSLDFIRYLNLTKVDDLPDYDKLHNLADLEQVINEAE